MNVRAEHATVETTMTSMAILIANAVGGIALARSLGPTGRGEFASLMVWAALASSIATLGTVGALTYFVAISEPASEIAFRHVRKSYPSMAFFGLSLYAAFAWASQVELGIALVAMTISVPIRTLLAQVQAYLRGRELFRALNGVRLAATAGGSVSVTLLALGGVLTVTSAALAHVGMLVVALSFALARGFRDRQATAIGKKVGSDDKVQSFWWYSARDFVQTIGMQGNQQVDLLALTLIAPPAAVGVYAVAVGFTAPIAMIGSSAGVVLFPRLARARTRRDEFVIFRRLVAYVAIIGGAAASGLLLLSDLLIPLLFGSEFTASAPVSRVLAVGVWAFGLSLVAGAALKGLGQPGVAAIGQLAGLAVTLGLILSVSGGGPLNVAYAAVGGFLVSLAIEGVALAVYFRPSRANCPR